MPKGSYTKSAEHRRKISNTLKGRPCPWNKGKKSGHWKGDKVGYDALHAWVRRNFGKADKCENKNCVYPRKRSDGTTILKPFGFEWANLDHKYTRKRKDWKMMCMSCHKRYDQEVLGVKFGAAKQK